MSAFMKIGIGEQILFELEFRNWNQATFAEAMDISEKHASKLINNQVQLSIDLAIKLEKLFEVPAKMWLSIDNEYRLSKQENNQLSCMELRGKLYSRFPIKNMKDLNWLDIKTSKTEELNKAIIDFIGTDDIDSFFENTPLKIAARSSEKYKDKFNIDFAKVWYRKAMLESNSLILPKYSHKNLELLMERMTGFTTTESGIELFIKELNNCGVGFLVLPHLSHTYLDGASFYNQDNPIIVYTARHDRLDNFWFTVLHEVGHIVKGHLDKERPILDSDNFKDKSESEKEADTFANKVMRLDEVKQATQSYNRVSKIKLEEVLEEFNFLHPSIIIGALQHARKISYRSYNDYKVKVKHLLN